MNCQYPNNKPTTGYTKGCRCDRCQAAKKEEQRKYREANKDAIREYRQDNKDAIAEYDREYRKANKDALKEQRRERYEANKDAILEQQREYQQANKDAIKEQKRDYYKANKEIYYAHSAKRRAVKKEQVCVYGEPLVGDDPKWHDKIVAEVYKRCPKDYHVDHVTTLFDGGLHFCGNLAPCTDEDNLRKNRNSGLTPSSIPFNELMDGAYVHTSYHIMKEETNEQ